MTQQDKELLIKDLSARLPYNNIKVKTPYGDAHMLGVVKRGFTKKDEYTDVLTDKANYLIRYIQPYLRSMSSMTENENLEYQRLWNGMMDGDILPDEFVDYLNSIHVDYRGLIKKGLALEAPEDMYV